MNDQELSVLFEKLLNNKCSEAEADRILVLLTDDDVSEDLKALIVNQLKKQPAVNSNEITDEVEMSLNARLNEILISNPPETARVRRLSLQKKLLYAAVVAMLFMSIGLYYFTKSKPDADFAAVPQKHAIMPGSNQATLTLSNGVTINLADVTNGSIATQAGITITKTKSGVVVYLVKANPQTTPTAQAAPIYNTITTPKGGQFEVILPDGSKVWLNAASSLRYPAQFANNERVVELNGEGYFEVSHLQQLNAEPGTKEKGKVPFIVMSSHQRIEVVGTHFNVNAYADESSIKTTLITGAVKVSVLNGNDLHKMTTPKMLSPGQQSEVTGDNLSIKEVNTESAMAWKNGSFQFDNEDIRVVMRKIARWYNVEVDYQGNMDGKVFSGIISKYKDVNEVLKMLELTGSVSFTIKDRKITVS